MILKVKTFIALILIFFCRIPLFSQTKITGMVTDSAGTPVSSASVSLIRLADSSLVTFYLTDDDGKFNFTKITPGRYRVHATHMSFRSQQKTIEVKSGQVETAVEDFILGDQDIIINGAVIVAEIPPVMLRGDTLEFNAGSFHTAPNAVVEDLLKKIPGIDVASDGTISVNGQQVNKILVDGKEFFGSDPRLATRNLPSDAISKVQVFDDKTDAEQVTGMNDGQTDMALNLKLKEDHKKGVFGSITAGGGTGDITKNRWLGKANLNAFHKESQFNLIANANNLNQAAFSFRELMQLTGSGDEMGRGGNIQIVLNDNESGLPMQQLITAQSQGVNNQAAGGLRGARSWGEKLTLSGSYLASWFNPDVRPETFRTYFLPDSTYNYVNLSDQSMDILNHRLQASLIWKPRTKTTLRVKPALSLYGINSNLQNFTSNHGSDLNLGSEASSSQLNNSGTWNLSNDVQFTHGFKRKGRSISLTHALNLQNADAEQTLNNQTTFFLADTTYASPLLKQRWFTASDQQNASGRVAYTEPIGSRWLIEANVNGGFAASTNARVAFAWNSAENNFTDTVSSLTNDFDASFLYGAGGLQLRRAGKKLNFSGGADYQQSKLKGSIAQNNFQIERNFSKILPNARVEYMFTKFKQLSINYRTKLQPPSVTQLQPLPDISNPLYQQTGNPDLDPQTSHNLNLEMRVLNPAKRKFMVFMANGSIYQNAIGENKTIDSNGVTTVIPINVNGNWNLNSRFMLDLPIQKLEGSINIEPRISLTRTQNFVNEVVNPAFTFSITPEISWDFEPTDSLEIELVSSYKIGQSNFAFGPNQDFSTWTSGVDVRWILPKGFNIGTDFNYNQITGRGATTRFPLWNASISKFFLKGQRGELKLTAFDILNKNLGITQTANTEYSERTGYNTLHRYFLLSFTWRIKPYVPGGGNRSYKIIRD